jgi:queuine/archaeosine tRNA-ribosyltransferase
MPRICIFHDRQDFDLARIAAKAVESLGHDYWMANSHSGGDWRRDVIDALSATNCIAAIVVWSEKAVANTIVVEEAEEALRARRPLLGVLRGNVQLPIGLRNLPRLLLSDSTGTGTENTTEISEKLARVLQSAGQASQRVRDIVLDGKRLSTPAFVFSVSSFETQISPARTLELLNLFTPSAVLVSAYDILGIRDNSPDVAPTPTILRELESKDTAVFMDSGNYEAYRFGDKFWQRSPWLLREAAARLRCDIVFSHDRIVDVQGADHVDVSNLADKLIDDANRDREATGGRRISPIIHAPRIKDGTYLSEFLPVLCAKVAKTLCPPMIAIAERELGDGILARARRVSSVRRELNRLGHKQPLHLLGTGNPLSMLILGYAGADSFDGLEWCRTVVDGETMRLHHFHQFDLFVEQRREIDDELLRDYLDSRDEVLTAKAKAVLHNLYFFQRFTREMQLAHLSGGYEELFDRYLPGQFGRLVKLLGGGETT